LLCLARQDPLAAKPQLSTGFASGARAPAILLGEALRKAQAALGSAQITAAIVLFSPPHLQLPQEALRRARAELGCLQFVVGSFPGIFTQDGSALGSSACAVQLLAAPFGLGWGQPPVRPAGGPYLLWDRPRSGPPHYGEACPGGACGVVASHISQWQGAHGRPLAGPLCLHLLGPLAARSQVSRGLRPLTEILPVRRQQGALLLALERYSALPLLARTIPYALRQARKLPLDRFLVVELPEDEDAEPELLAITATDIGHSGLWLERPLRPGARVYLAVRDPELALRDTRLALEALTTDEFTAHTAWISSSVGRGANFFGARDEDLALWRERFGALPTLGVYALGEFWPDAGGHTRLLRFSKVFTMMGSSHRSSAEG